MVKANVPACGKIRESGMPSEEVWCSFFNVEANGDSTRECCRDYVKHVFTDRASERDSPFERQVRASRSQ